MRKAEIWDLCQLIGTARRPIATHKAAFKARPRPTSTDADDVIQETLISLIRVFPVYHYVPDEKGSFHNYLTGILRHKARKLIARESLRSALNAAYANEPPTAETADESAYKRSSASTSPSGTSVTLVDGKVVGVGTPHYAAPEQTPLRRVAFATSSAKDPISTSSILIAMSSPATTPTWKTSMVLTTPWSLKAPKP